MSAETLTLDEWGVASLDGVWDFFPGAFDLAGLDAATPQEITVPALWEAQGHLELDGVAWYRRSFAVDDPSGWWTLRFGAVMDVADVYLNGVPLGSHESPFTPFELDPTEVLTGGTNVLAVRVFDPSLHDPEHTRMPHGKQGWANHVFPSRPSLYMTYGGIWQPVTLRRHGPGALGDVFVNGDPADLTVEVEVQNRTAESRPFRVSVSTLMAVDDADVTLEPHARTTVTLRLGATHAAQWSPDAPNLHWARIDLFAGDDLSDVHHQRYGLRTIVRNGEHLAINGEPYRMKSVLVQGFTADRLYDEGDRDEIEAEVRAAQAMGFNTVRLHIKAFNPTYLDVCDELGMFVHSDLPVAEPIAYEEMGNGTVLSERCVVAIQEQVRRDRNHPSIVLWSAMNELCFDHIEARQWDIYEEFARTLVAAVEAVDATRPVIENDWPEPDPDRVFASPILTAHWYGRLHAEYLRKIEDDCRHWAGTGRPLYVTEFGDWGLPEMPALPDAPFWDTREVYVRGLTAALWPGTVDSFVIETHRYQGLSDRLQAEVFRRHDHIGGYCLTELTDVPHELNGVLDIHRRPKPLAVAEVRRMNQTVLPMLALENLVVGTGEEITAPLHIANDGPELRDVTIEARFGDADLPSWAMWCEVVEAHRAQLVNEVHVRAPGVPGGHDLIVVLCGADGTTVAENRYPIHVVVVPPQDDPVDGGPTIVREGELDQQAGAELRDRLAAGETVIVLAQPPEAGGHYPVPLHLEPVGTAWGSSEFHFTTDHGALTSFPRRTVLAAEDSTIQAHSVVTSIGETSWPTTPVVIGYKPAPSQLTGTVVGAQDVGPGRMIFCQYRLTERATAGDAAARALLHDLVQWATSPRPPLVREEITMPDGRGQTLYSYERAR